MVYIVAVLVTDVTYLVLRDVRCDNRKIKFVVNYELLFPELIWFLRHLEETKIPAANIMMSMQKKAEFVLQKFHIHL